MNMPAGKLNKRLEIESLDRWQDTAGDTEEEYVHFATVWGALEPVSVRQLIASRSEQSEVSALVTIRHRDDLDPTMRFVHRGKYYYIVGLLADKESGLEYITVPVKEGLKK